MSIVLPFKALRPQRQFAKAVAAHPYDVLSLEEAREIARNNPMSFLRVEKSEIEVPGSLDLGSDRAYRIAEENLKDFIQKGILFRDENPCYYIYRQKMGNHEQYGIAARFSVAEYETGKIKKHELTRRDKELDRTNHVATVNAHTGPVFLTYMAKKSIDSMVEKVIQGEPEYDFTTDDGVAHTVWVISDSALIEDMKAAFASVDALYIADGHHRAAAATAVSKLKRAQNPDRAGDEAYNTMLAVIFPHDQLRIMDYNRVVKDLHGSTVSDFFKNIEKHFIISENFQEKSPGQLHEFGMYLQGNWFKLTARPGSFNDKDSIEVLDVFILQNNLLGPILGIQDPRSDKRIDFVGGIRGMNELEKLVDSGTFAVAFSLYPPTLTQMMAVADDGKVMPPKSTWFEPKLRSGVLVNLLS